jgi:protein SCO1/2
MLLLTLLLLGEPDSRLAVIRSAPEFTLTTHEDKQLSFSKLKGKVCLVSFIFTTCNGSCPATTHRMAQVQEAAHNKGMDKDGRVQLISISLDPTRDTPEVLRGYMKLYDVDAANWTFLTGNKDKVEKVVADWGMWAKPAANGQLDHPSRIFLVDKQGRIREIYNLAYMKTAWVVEDIELLAKECEHYWDAQGTGFLAKNASKPCLHSSVNRGAALALAASSTESA